MKKELDYFRVDNWIGGNQDRVIDPILHFAGCAAIAASDSCVFLSRYFGRTALYPSPSDHLTKKEYTALLRRMKKYLHPQKYGIDNVRQFILGFRNYLNDAGESGLWAEEYSTHHSEADGITVIRRQIDSGILVPFLMLRNRDKSLSWYDWHWFLVTGYEDREDGFYIRVTTYGTHIWLALHRLWETGFDKKGGLVIYHLN